MRRGTILGVLILCLLVAAGAYLYMHGTQADVAQGGNATSTPKAAAAAALQVPHRTPPAGQLEYRSDAYHFSLFYPQNLDVRNYDEGHGALTVTFTSKDQTQAFQIFLVPYGEQQVSAERFKMDEPSGVMKDPTSVLVDGASAQMFFGNNTAMGDTREVWFIRGGYLYEVTTYKSLDSWLSQIMSSWQFI